MSLTRLALFRAAKRVFLSTTGEIVGRSVNIFIPFLVLFVHEVSIQTDYFFLAIAIAFFTQGGITNALVASLVPKFIKDSNQYNMLPYCRWVALAAVITGILTTALAMNQTFSYDALIISLSASIMACAGILSAPAVAILNANHQYGLPGVTWSFRLLPVGLYFIWAPREPALPYLLLGMALSDAFRTVVLVSITRAQLCLHKTIENSHFPLAAQHLLISSFIVGLIPLTLRWITTNGNPGDLSIFEAADRLYSAFASLATIGVGNVTLVYLARLGNSPEEHNGWMTIMKTSLIWGFLCLVAAVVFWLSLPFATSLMNVQYDETLEQIRHVFLFLSLGIPGFIMTGLFSRRLLTLNFSHTLIPISMVSLLFSTLLGGLIFSSLGIIGIAVALSANQYLIASLLFLKLMKYKTHENTHSI